MISHPGDPPPDAETDTATAEDPSSPSSTRRTEVHETTIEFVRPWLYEKQFNAIYDPKRLSLIEASTKAGKTVGCIIWLVEQALFGGGDGRNYWWVAPVATQAEIAFTRMLRYLPQGSFTANRTLKTIVLMNGAIIWFKGADRPDTLYGEDVHAAVIDEASRFKQAAWEAVRSTLVATQGPLRIIGNVKGRKNWFYRLARRAEQGAPDMGYHKITAHDAVAAGVLVQEEIDTVRTEMSENAFRELFLAEASDDEGNPFGAEHIRACTKPLSHKPPRVWGWDLGKHIDYTVGIALDDAGDTCRFERFQLPWEATIDFIIEVTGKIRALVDSTGVGDPIVERLQKLTGAHFVPSNVGSQMKLIGHPIFEGYQFTAPSKQKLMEGLAVAIQSHSVGYPDGPIVRELEQFEYEYTRTGVRYGAPEGYHDDCVCALALAKMHQGHVPPPLIITPEALARSRIAPLRRPS